MNYDYDIWGASWLVTQRRESVIRELNYATWYITYVQKEVWYDKIYSNNKHWSGLPLTQDIKIPWLFPDLSLTYLHFSLTNHTYKN